MVTLEEDAVAVGVLRRRRLRRLFNTWMRRWTTEAKQRKGKLGSHVPSAHSAIGGGALSGEGAGGEGVRDSVEVGSMLDGWE